MITANVYWHIRKVIWQKRKFSLKTTLTVRYGRKSFVKKWKAFDKKGKTKHSKGIILYAVFSKTISPVIFAYQTIPFLCNGQINASLHLFGHFFKRGLSFVKICKVRTVIRKNFYIYFNRKLYTKKNWQSINNRIIVLVI